MKPEALQNLVNALQDLVSTITAAGGVYQGDDGLYAPVGDPEWIDLGEAYVRACHALGIEPRIQEEEEP